MRQKGGEPGPPTRSNGFTKTVTVVEELHARSKRVLKALNFNGYGPTQLISEHTFLCTVKHSSPLFVEYPRLSLN